jgi:hypothetical protein
VDREGSHVELECPGYGQVGPFRREPWQLNVEEVDDVDCLDIAVEPGPQVERHGEKYSRSPLQPARPVTVALEQPVRDSYKPERSVILAVLYEQV